MIFTFNCLPALLTASVVDIDVNPNISVILLIGVNTTRYSVVLSNTSPLVINDPILIKLPLSVPKLVGLPFVVNSTFSNSNAQNLELMVYDSEGKLKFKKDFGVIQEGEFSVEGWPRGVYFAEFWGKKNRNKVKTSAIKISVQ